MDKIINQIKLGPTAADQNRKRNHYRIPNIFLTHVFNFFIKGFFVAQIVIVAVS